jgi:hypothetical protein
MPLSPNFQGLNADLETLKNPAIAVVYQVLRSTCPCYFPPMIVFSPFALLPAPSGGHLVPALAVSLATAMQNNQNPYDY